MNALSYRLLEGAEVVRVVRERLASDPLAVTELAIFDRLAADEVDLLIRQERGE